MIRRGWAIRSAAAFLLTLTAVPATARPIAIAIAIGRFDSEKACTTYQMSAGRMAAVATQDGAAMAASWRTWLVRDCVDNFASSKASLRAAIASAGIDADAVADHHGPYTLSGTISEIGTQTSDMATAGVRVRSEQVAVTMNILLRDAAGRTVYGDTITRHLEIGSSVQGTAMASSGSIDGRAVYTQLETATARAAARAVLFHLAPPVVTETDGRNIRVNYGAPLVDVGTMIQVRGADGRTLRYTVGSADDHGASAEPDGQRGEVRVGSPATIIEPDAPGANARRYDRVDLP